MEAAGLWNAGFRNDNSVSVENRLDPLSGNRAGGHAEKERNPNHQKDYKATFHSLTPMCQSVMMPGISHKCKPEIRPVRAASAASRPGGWGPVGAGGASVSRKQPDGPKLAKGREPETRDRAPAVSGPMPLFSESEMGISDRCGVT